MVGTNLKIKKEQNATIVEGYKKAYDNVYKGASESVKETMDRYVSTSDAVIKQSVIDKSKSSSHNHQSDYSQTVQEPLKPEDYHIQSNGKLHLNQQKIAEDKLDEEISNLMDKYDEMDRQNSKNSGPKFKLKDDNK